MKASSHQRQTVPITNVIPVYYIPTGTPSNGLTPQEHPGPPGGPMLLQGQQTYISQQGKQTQFLLL